MSELLKNRKEFLQHLRNDLAKNETLIDSTLTKLEDLKLTSGNVQELGAKVEHTALIPLGKKIYVNANIIHTGEYFLDKVAFPESYSVVETLNNTLKHLDQKIQNEKETLLKCETVRDQISERISLLETKSNNDLPPEIVSDKGVAIQVGDFYEIVEFEP